MRSAAVRTCCPLPPHGSFAAYRIVIVRRLLAGEIERFRLHREHSRNGGQPIGEYAWFASISISTALGTRKTQRDTAFHSSQCALGARSGFTPAN
ncbi:hypothetical protein [Burkholderia sp. MSMB1588]|uniref:hypothetical protein n=1 Tax=Burkholderia sp. MSMB1588 TaxID=1636423 RepID=UPI00149575BF|nr:hypothetical protein [Burkholderia sp. MSMB1588]